MKKRERARKKRERARARVRDRLREKGGTMSDEATNSRGGSSRRPDFPSTVCFKALLKPVASVFRSVRGVDKIKMIYSQHRDLDELIDLSDHSTRISGFYSQPIAAGSSTSSTSSNSSSSTNTHSQSLGHGAGTSTLTVMLICEGGVTKTHSFHVEATTLTEATFSPKLDGPNSFALRPKILGQLLERIHGAQEIALEIVLPNSDPSQEGGIRLSSHHRSEEESSQSLSSDLLVPRKELKQLIISDEFSGSNKRKLSASVAPSQDSEAPFLIFPQRDMKAFLSFCLGSIGGYSSSRSSASTSTSSSIIGQSINNITAMFRDIGDPLLLSTRLPAALVRAEMASDKLRAEREAAEEAGLETFIGQEPDPLAGGGLNFSADMIIATVASSERDSDEFSRGNDAGGSSEPVKKART